MNFQELMQRMHELDQPVVEEPNEGNLFTGNLAAARAAGKDEADLDGDGEMEKVHEGEVEGCGMPPMDTMKQSDSVSMNVNMNGSGAGGIRDLLDILKNLDGGSGEHGDAHDLGDLIDKMDGPDDGMIPMKKPVVVGDMPVDEFANEPDEMYAQPSAVTPTGDDLHSKGLEFPKVNGGGNPMTMESLINRLDALYQDVKSR